MPHNQFPFLTASNTLLHITTILYVLLLIVCDPNVLSIVFSVLYMLEMCVKYVQQPRVYRSGYYSWGFVLVDALAGPFALLLSVYELAKGRSLIHIGCIFIVLKVTTCKLYIVIMKEIYYVAAAAWYYLRLSLGVFVCFSCLSFYTFRSVSKYYCSLHESIFSMYQLSTFDAWDEEPVGEIRGYLSNAWVLYFFAYFLLMIITYLATMLSFFTTYYTTPEVQLDFRFKDHQYILVKEMAQILGLEKYPRRRPEFREFEMYLAGFVLWAIIESTDEKYIAYRVYVLFLVIFVSLCVFFYRIVGQEETTMKLSTVLAGLKAFGGLFTIIFCLIYKSSTVLVIWLYLVFVLIDLIRYNTVVLNLFKNNWLTISQYLIIIYATCYVLAVIISRNQDLLKIESMVPKIKDLFNAFLFNVEIMGFDGWGKLAKETLKQRPQWIYYFVVVVFVVGFLLVNVFAGEVVELVTPEIEAELKLSQRDNTHLHYTDLNEFVKQCRAKMKSSDLERE